jgi:hypothetical protein
MLCTGFSLYFKFRSEAIESEANIERRRVYRKRFNLVQKKKFLSNWNKLISKVEIEMLCFDFVDKFYLVENIVKTKTKEKWVKEDNIVVSSRLYVNS